MNVLCCEKCFVDQDLKLFIRKSRIKAVCGYCGATSNNCIHPKELARMFKPLLELFTEESCVSEPQGSNLPTVINEIWDIFSDTLADEARCSLLDDIRGDANGNQIVNRINGEDESKSEDSWVIAPRLEYGLEAVKWEEFCRHLKTANRFFPVGQNDPIHVIKKMIRLISKTIHSGDKLFRARVSPSNIRPRFYKFNDNELNAPPPENARANRINPEGIPVLYTSESEETAIAEVRPWVGTIVSIATFKTVRELNIVDFSDLEPFNRPFQNSDLVALRIYKYVATILNRAFSTPVSSSDSLFEYLPTQYVASLIKNEDFDGIRYRSAVHDSGKNVALFDCEACKSIGPVSYYEIENIRYKHRKHSSSMSYHVRCDARTTG